MNFVEDKKSDEKLGDYIARIRTERGMSQEDLAVATKVALSHVKLIELGDWKAFPVEAYIRGYLNSISVKLNMDPKKVRSWYGSETGGAAQVLFNDVSGVEKISSLSEAEPKKKVKALPIIVIVIIGLAFLVASQLLDMGAAFESFKSEPASDPVVAVDTTSEQEEIPDGAIMSIGENPLAEDSTSMDSNMVSQAEVDAAVKKKSELPASATIFISSDSKKDSVPPTNKTTIELYGSGVGTSWVGMKRRESDSRFAKEGYINKGGAKVSYSTEDTLSVTIGDPRACSKMILNGVETPLPTTRYGRVIKFRVYGGQVIK